MSPGMNRTSLASLVVVSGLLAACGGRIEQDDGNGPGPSPTAVPTATISPAPEDPPAPPVAPAPDAGVDEGAPSTGTSKAAITAEGVVSVQSGAVTFEISLAILPRTFSKGGLYEYEGPRYPTTTAAREALVDSVAFTYGELAKECVTRHPEIVLPKPGDPEATVNKALEAVAACAYTDFGIKPYWIPRLVSDVDICARKLGPDYHLPTVADVKALTADERAAIGATLREGLYNGLSIFVRAADGTLVLADLATGATRKLSEGGATYWGDTYHYEGGASLRCIRR